MSEPAKGVWAIILACSIWGFQPIYFKALSHISAVEVLAHRTFWSLVIFSVILAVQGRIGDLRAVIGWKRETALIVFAALMISVNWFLSIWAVQNGRAMQSSLGYYIFPLVAVVIGRVVFGERLGRVQWGAIGLAAVAVIVLTLGLGAPPWIALILATTFGMYGLVKKQLSVGPVVSVTAEVLVLLPVTLGLLFWIYNRGDMGFGGNSSDTFMLVLSGLLTATPLILFSYATRRVNLATVGLVQYLNPTLQFFCAVAIFGEPFGKWHGFAFAMIWTALGIYSVASLRSGRKAA